MTPRRAALTASVALLCLAALLAAGFAGWFFHFLHQPYSGWEGRQVVVNVASGLDAGSMLDQLADAGVVRRPALVRRWLSVRGGAERLHAGEYAFDRAISPAELLRRLVQGDVVLHAVTLPEGLTAAEVADRLAAAELGERDTLLEAFGDASLVGDLAPDALDLEGYLFPDTYHFPAGEDPSRIAAAMVARFREVIGEDYRSEAQGAGLDLGRAVVLASLIEKETSVPDERGRISRVFHNRLDRGMRMECDPTVVYGLERAGRSVDRLTFGDLRVETAWNTYVIEGLPPGPIANPGRESLFAAVRPAEGDELYFVAAPEGGHTFSRTLSEHNRHVATWRRYLRSSR